MFAVVLVGLVAVSTAQATWSIILVDTRTGEIAIGSATCICGIDIDLQVDVPVVRIGLGAAAAQSLVDGSARNRKLIWAELAKRTAPDEILQMLADNDPAHQQRQYGIVDTLGRAVTFSGRFNGDYANGVTGSFGTVVYAIQGNVITGQPVLDAAEAAVINEPGGLPEKLMAGMEAARSMGGDGRCSCSQANPDGCGSPPPSFTKSAHVGFIIDARLGDVEGRCGRRVGCASGDYYMEFNVANAACDDPDPVIQLRDMFDAWRAGLVGVTDAVESTVDIPTHYLPNDGATTIDLTVTLRDYAGNVPTGVLSVEALHDPNNSAESSSIGPVVLLDPNDQVYQVSVTAGTRIGLDNIRIQVTDSAGTRPLMPLVALAIQDMRADLDGSGRVDLDDLTLLLASFGSGIGGDVDGDGDTDLNDLTALLRTLILLNTP